MLRPFAAFLILSSAFAQTWIPQTSGTTASLRGLCAVNPRIVWASGAGGTVLRTIDGGASWHASVVPGAADLDFRAIHALDADRAWILSSGPGPKSRIYRTADGGAHWTLLYTNPDAGGFFDGLAFWDSRRGVVLGDPVDGQFVILTTTDAGQTWRRSKLPPALAGEGAFAASNSSLVLRGKQEIWFSTGGPSAARVFHSQDGGVHWDVAATPIRHDGAGAGIFSLSFADASNAMVVGGDYSQPAAATGNIAISTNGARTWMEPDGTHPHGYRSAVVFVPARQLWIAVGTSGSDVSTDAGKTWKTIDTQSYNALAAVTNRVWAVGPAGHIAVLH